MIVQIRGTLIDLDPGSAIVEVGSLAYEVMLPGYCVSSLSGSIGKEITLCTMEYYEGTPGGGNLIPRLVGFNTRGERDFFALYTGVKGMGIRKGLKSLAMPIETIAGAIENEDEKFLKSLPGVGPRLAQHIIAELSGKLVTFAMQGYSGSGEGKGAKTDFTDYQIEALEILIAWGEKRNEAIELIQRTVQNHPETKSAEELVPLIYKLKQGAEV
jgi:holliday junction DNA helicase RuvA